MDRRFLVSAVVTLAAMPFVAGGVAVVLAWCLHKWNMPIWLLGMVGFVLLCGISYGVWQLARKLTSGRFAFSMRAMLIGVAVVAVALGTVCRWMLETYRQQLAIRTMSTFGGFRSDYGQRDNWLHTWLGYDPFDIVEVLDIQGDQALSTFIKHADQFADIETVIFGRGVSPAGFARLRHLNLFPKLRVPNFIESSIDSRGLQHLRELTNVSGLFFNGCPNITDAGLQHLVDLPNLKELSLIEEGGGMSITDAGLVHVGRMKNLKMLMLIGMPQVTDAGLAHLHALSKLETLVLRRTAATEQGVTQLYKVLPDCNVITDVFVPGRANVQQIVVWRIGQPKEPVSVVSDADRIGKIRELVRSIDETSQQIDDRERFEPLPTTWRLEFEGETRTLYEVRLGNGALQWRYLDQWGWVKWELSDGQEAQFLEMLGLNK